MLCLHTLKNGLQVYLFIGYDEAANITMKTIMTHQAVKKLTTTNYYASSSTSSLLLLISETKEQNPIIRSQKKNHAATTSINS